MGLVLTQKKYALDLLRRAGMLHYQPVLTPMTVTERLTSTDGDLLSSEDANMYRSIIGGLQYILHTRPDLSFAVNKVCQFLHAPRSPHWSAVKRTLRYIQHIVSHGLHIHAASSAFSDADWAGSYEDRRSTEGHAILYGPNLIA
jgi:histone deacetylase 1/2